MCPGFFRGLFVIKHSKDGKKQIFTVIRVKYMKKVWFLYGPVVCENQYFFMCVYTRFSSIYFISEKWVGSIHLPHELFDMHFCTYRNQLLFIRAKEGNSPRFLGYLFSTYKNSWTVIESNRTYDNIPKRYITFSEDNRIYVRGKFFL